jgi:hypothetical protein
VSAVLEEPIVLSQLVTDGIVWQLRRSVDRGRLEVVAVVPASVSPTVIRSLTDRELRALLVDTPALRPEPWRCLHCGTSNAPAREWCRVCSETLVSQ